ETQHRAPERAACGVGAVHGESVLEHADRQVALRVVAVAVEIEARARTTRGGVPREEGAAAKHGETGLAAKGSDVDRLIEGRRDPRADEVKPDRAGARHHVAI